MEVPPKTMEPKGGPLSFLSLYEKNLLKIM